MKNVTSFWLSLSAPLLVFLALFGMFQRKGSDRAQSIPALAIGSGLIFSSVLGHQLRRKKLFIQLNKSNDEN